MFYIHLLMGAAIAWAIYPGAKNVKAKFIEWKNRNLSSAKDNLAKVEQKVDEVKKAVGK